MAEALAALGVFCNVLQVAEFVWKILEKGQEIQKSSTGALADNEALEECSRQLVAKNDALQQSLWESLQLPAGERDEDDVALNKLAVDCNREATDLINQLRRVAVADTSSRTKTVRAALRAVWDKDKIDGIAKRMKGFQDTMNSRLILSISLRQKFITAQQSDGFERLLARGDEMSTALKQLQLTQRQISSTQGTQHQALVDIVTSQHEEMMRVVTNQQSHSIGNELLSYEQPAVDESKVNLIELINKHQVEPVKELLFQKRALAIQALDHTERTGLHYAALAGNLELTKAFIKRGASINAQDENNCTSLHLAVKADRPACVRYLVFQGANKEIKDDSMKMPINYTTWLNECAWVLKYGHEINAKDENGSTALVYFVKHRRFHAIHSLLAQDAPISYQAGLKGQTTPLMTACEQGYEDVVELLIQSRADANCKSAYDESPLSEAARHGHIRIAEMLLKHGADINTRNGDNSTPLLEACMRGHDALGEVLINKGADVEALHKQGLQLAIHLAAKSGCIRSVAAIVGRNKRYAHNRNGGGWKPLGEACWWGHEAVVDFLLDYEPEMRYIGNHLGRAPLSLAASAGFHRVIRLLVKKGGADLELQDANGKTALINAIEDKHYNAVRELLALGADANHSEQQRNGFLPLSFAIVSNNHEMLRLLLHEGRADPNNWNSGDSCTPLIEATRRGFVTMAEDLLDAGADPDLVAADPHLDGGRHYPPVCFAAKDCNKRGLDMLILLVEKGKADLSLSNATHKWTALHEVGCHGPLSAVKYLLAHGADPWAEGIDEKTGKEATPLDLAFRERRGQIGAELRRAMEEKRPTAAGAAESEAKADFGEAVMKKEGWHVLEHS